MNEVKKSFPIFRFFIVFAILILIFSLVLHYFINRRNILSFIPSKYITLIKTPPLKDVYEHYLPLEVMDIIFSEPAMIPSRKIIFALRGNEILKNFFAKQLLNIPIIISVESKNKALFAFDIGYLSIFTRILPFIGYNLDIKNLTLIKKGKLVTFKLSGGTDIYFSFVDNILLLSLDSESIEKAFERFKNKENFLEKRSRRLVEALTKESGKNIKILVSPDDLKANFFSENEIINKIFEKIKFTDDAIIELFINNSNVNINLDIPVYSDDMALQKIISSKFTYLNVIKLIPSDISTLSILNLCNSTELISIMQNLDISEVNDSLKKADDTLKTLFGKDSKELIFSWIGSEIGIYKGIKSEQPVVFFEIKDLNKFNQFNNKVLKSFIIETKTNLRVENVPINQIKVVDFLQFILGIFKINIPSGFYITVGNYFFISLDPENLKEIVVNFREKNTLYENRKFKSFTKNFPLYSGFFSYYDFGKGNPIFKSNNSFTKLLDFYSAGAISMWHDRTIKLNISGLSEVKNIAGFINFPKSADVDTKSTFLVKRIKTSSEPYFFYFRKDNTFVIQDIDLKTIFETNFNETGEIIFDDKKEMDDFYIFLKQSQKLIYFRISKTSFTTIEINDVDATFTPFYFKGKLYFYSVAKKRFLMIDSTSQKPAETYLLSDEQINEKPYIWSDYWGYFLPENKMIYLANKLQTLSGWPAKIDEIAYGNPVILVDHGEIKIYLITDNGKLYGWNFEGKVLKGFPVIINDNFSRSLIKIKINSVEKLLAISKGKNLYFISPDGNIISTNFIREIDDKNISVFDINNDGTDEIFTSREKIALYMFSKNMIEETETFNGIVKPVFIDLNNDNNLEIISADESRIYVYSYKR